MKAQIIRSDIEISVRTPDALKYLQDRAGIIAPVEALLKHFHDTPHPDIEVRAIRRNYRTQLVPYWRKGMIMEHPEVWKGVIEGWCIPADDECADRAGMTSEQMAHHQKVYDRNAHGIAPEDWDLYDAGVISGYHPNEAFKPGPNWDKRQALFPKRFPTVKVETEDAKVASALN